MTSAGRLRLRLWFYGIVLGYLVCDFIIFHGPLHHAVAGMFRPSADLAAEVGSERLTTGQVERATLEKLKLQGKDPAALSAFERKTIRLEALNELIDHEILRQAAAARQDEIEVTEAEIDARLRLLAGRFETRAAMMESARAQGIKDERNLRYREASLIRQEKLVALETAARTKITEEEARKWFDANKDRLRVPALTEVRHVFLPTLEVSEAEAQEKLEAALADLVAGKKDFATLAKEISRDPASSENGGRLGWLAADDRLIPDFTEPVFALEVSKPTLVRSRLGWHLVEVTAKAPARDRTFDETKMEIAAALEALKRREATAAFHAGLRREFGGKIEIYADRVNDAPFLSSGTDHPPTP